MKVALLLLIACGPATPAAQTVELPHNAPVSPATSPPSLEPMSATPRVSSEMASLAKQRIEVAQQYAKLSRAMYQAGNITSATYFDAEREVFLAQRDSGLKGAELVAAARAYRDASVAASQLAEQRQKIGASSEADVQLAKLRSLEAAYWLAQASAE